MSRFSRKETGKPCQVCGRPTTPQNPAVETRDGFRVHESHTTDIASGLYGDRKRGLFRR